MKKFKERKYSLDEVCMHGYKYNKAFSSNPIFVSHDFRDRDTYSNDPRAPPGLENSYQLSNINDEGDLNAYSHCHERGVNMLQR